MTSQSVRPDILSKASSFYSQMNAAATPNNVYNVGEQNNAKPFPVQLGTADPEDLQMDLRQQVIGTNGQVNGFGQAIADDRVFSYLERKKEAQIEGDFRQWMISQTDFSDPAKAEFWNKVAPWITDEKLKQIDKNAELQKRLAIINVRGPQTEEDFKILYMIQNGIIKVPSKPVQDMDEDNQIVNQELDFTRGFFNPLAKKPNEYGYPHADNNKPATWAHPFRKGAMPVEAVGRKRDVSGGADDFISKVLKRGK